MKDKEKIKEDFNARMNPVPAKEFDPATFDPMRGHPHYELFKRKRAVPPRTLPTEGLLPKEVREGQMIGEFESKQDLYLLIAWLSKRVSDLEDKIATDT
jgi:hypothetical protein